MVTKFAQQKKLTVFVVMLFMLSLVACTSTESPTVVPSAEPTSAPQELPTEQQVGMPNPAAVNCEDKGGRVEIRTDSQGGQYGVCIFPDGSECDEWAFFRGECQPGQSLVAPSPVPMPAYLNDELGFALDPPSTWSIEEFDNYVVLRRTLPDGSGYKLFIGVVRAGEQAPPFRTGMPSGEFVDGGVFALMERKLPKRNLVLDGKIKVVEYGVNLEAGDLRLFIWLDGEGVDYQALNIPAEVIAEADQIIASFSTNVSLYLPFVTR